MKLLKFKTRRAYLIKQKRTDAKKLPGASVSRGEIELIASWLESFGGPTAWIMCHGARHGHEIDWFSEMIPDAEVVMGTDLFSKGHPSIVMHDFHEEKAEWIGAFDLVYSNAWDHSRYPNVAIKTWLRQLNPSGRLILQWSKWHGDRHTHGGDCFGCQFDELIEFVQNCRGAIVDVIHVHSTFVCLVFERKR